MAKTVSNTDTDFALAMINSQDLKKLFDELQSSVQIQVLNAAFRKAGKPILEQAKANFMAIKKGKSKDGYSTFDKAFKMTALKKDIGMIIGLKHQEGYKYRFIEYGTAERQYKVKKSSSNKEGKAGFYKSAAGMHSTGVIKPSQFFENAVAQKGNESQELLSAEIVLSLERCVKRYEKNASKNDKTRISLW